MKYLPILLSALSITACQAKESQKTVPNSSEQQTDKKNAKSNLTTKSDNTLTPKGQPKLTQQALRQKYGKNYLYYNFDINADGLKDLIITVNPRNADKVKDDLDTLYIYTAKAENNFQLSLKSINFDEDGGNQFSQVIPRANHNGFIISTVFPDHGWFIKYYYIKPANSAGTDWVLEKMIYNGDVPKDYEAIQYYCVFPQNNVSLKGDFDLKSHEWTDEEKLTKCPMPPTHYIVTAQKAPILNDDFEATNPPNYFIKGDKIEAIEQNDDWIRILYKNENKTGWISKKYLITNSVKS